MITKNPINHIKFLNFFILILSSIFISILVFTQGTIHENIIGFIPLYIFIISMIYLSFLIFQDCKDKNLNAVLFSIENFVLFPFLIGLIIYLLKRRRGTTKNNYGILFKLLIALNLILAMCSTVLILFIIMCNFLDPTNTFYRILGTNINGFIFVTFPLLFIIFLILLIFITAYKVKVSIDPTINVNPFLLRLFTLLLIINTVPLIYNLVGIYFWVCI